MSRTTTRFTTTGLAFCISLVAPAVAHAQSAYPTQRVSMLVGFAAGGFADTIGRLVATRLGDKLGQPFVVQNLAGAGSVRATRQASIAPADGYTILATTTAIAINESLVPDRGYEATAVQTIAIPVTAPEAITANLDTPIGSVAYLVALAKEGKVFLGSPGIGSGSQIAAEYFFKVLAKVDMRHIPFAGGSPAMQGLMTGDVNVLATTATGTTVRNIVGGQIKGVAIAAKERSAVIASVPTFAESGYPGFEAASWVGFFAPAGTPTPIIGKLNAEINAVMREDEMRRRMDAVGLDMIIRDVAETDKYFRSEVANWSRMVETAGVKQ